MLRFAPLAVLCLILAVVVSTASATPKSAVSDPSITLDQSDPHLGGVVTFTVRYPTKVKSPRVAVRCYSADGTLIYAEAGPYDQSFLLGGASSDWLTVGGPAHCTGELFYFVWNGNQPQQYYSLAWTSFDAAG
jgi:hypothetical protein